MKSMSKLALVLLCLSAVVVVGCDKEVKLVFINTTDETLKVDVDSITAKPTMSIELTMTPLQQKEILWKWDEKDLPAQVQWDAGVYKGSFAINKDTPKVKQIPITGDSNPARNTPAAKAQRALDRIKTRTETVIE
jgi:hypothetical protein